MVFLRKSMQISECTVKNVTYIFLFVCAAILFHVWILQDLITFLDNIHSMISVTRTVARSRTENTKYILLWDRYGHFMKRYGRSIFPQFNCSVDDCVFTDDRGLLGDYTLFDAIIFNDQHLYSTERPIRRSPKQLYIFTTQESPCNVPSCDARNDNFFNWTFTFRLDSDVVWSYFVVRNATRHIVAPRKVMHWRIYRHPIDSSILSLFNNRKKAAAWIVSHCEAPSLRDDYLSELQEHMHHYSLELDVYGGCNNMKCDDDDCEQMLRNNYFFYMAFENSISEDYVTEKVLHGYDNYVVPIVYGGANYSRFLPPGSYINARRYHPYNLARKIHLAVTQPMVYLSYFLWTNFYTIDPPGYEGYHSLCDLCEALHSDKADNAPAKKDFRLWWNTKKGMKWCLPEEFWNETSRLNINGKYIYASHNIY